MTPHLDDLVSLVMAAWNPRQDWLRVAVESALDQRGCSIEVIVVDDGSDVPVATLLDNVRDERLRVIRVEHGGVAHASDAGLAASHGRWIRFIGCDDVFLSWSTARLLQMTRGEEVIGYGATRYCTADLTPLGTMSSTLQGWVLEECLLNRFSVGIGCMLFPRSVVERAGGWDPTIKVSSDWDFVLKALEHAPVRGDRTVATLYRRHRDSITARPAPAEGGVERVVDRYFERHPERRGTALEREARAQVQLILAATHRDAYLAHLGRAYSLHRRNAVRELGTLGLSVARLVGARATRVVRERLIRDGAPS